MLGCVILLRTPGHSGMHKLPRAFFFFILSLTFFTIPDPAAGQAIFGRILLAGDTTGVEGATVTLRDNNGRFLLQVQSDATGRFRIPLDFPGPFGISASRIGLRTVNAEVTLGEREMVEVELRMAPEAIPLDPLVVTARRIIRPGTLDEYYDRMERNRQRGVGRFITREEVEGSFAASTTLLLGQVPGIFLEPTGQSGWGLAMRYRGESCAPDYYLDGLLTSSDRLPPMEDIEGVEIYRGRFENVEGYWPSDCGAIFMWRKRDWGNPFSWRKLFLAVGFVAIGFALSQIW